MGIDGEGSGFSWCRLLLRGVEADPVQRIEDIASGVLASRRITSGSEAAFRQALCVVPDEMRDASKVVVAGLYLHRRRRRRWW